MSILFILVKLLNILFILHHIGGVMVIVLTSSAVDRGFIGGVIVRVFALSAVDRGLIGGVS